ncbi:RNA polymerase sigma factor [Streptomyces kaniharaensis]|uniref:RNA polymerase sigma factor n=1 Tax=Streptomyces kaniharaensis TaxID=212423 RepID=A0A6N7KU71_9ACTN|nr:RNA polymerase sigma factor [Streptomyces kaniharaensis]MQS15070.1 RNA polymerase sigma factor [Streptomyces kaniharaensis]
MVEFSSRCTGGREPGGEPADFDRVFTEMLPRLHRAAVSLAGSPFTAGDIVHDAYLRIARRPERFLGHPQPYAYVFTTMANILRDQWRRERRRATLPEPVGREQERAAVADPLGGGMAELQARWEVVRLLRCLTAKQARVVVLVDLDGYSVDEAAELLGLHRSTLAVTRRRAHRRLRAVLERERRGEGEGRRRGGSGCGRASGGAPDDAPDAPN